VAKHAALNQRLEELQLRQDVPTEQDLAQARCRRDSGWQLVRQAWRGPAVDENLAAAFIREVAPGCDLEQAFQASMEAVDHIADRLRREADRVAKKAKLTADRHELDKHLAGITEHLAAAQVGHGTLAERWNEICTALRIEPISPREVRAWLIQHGALMSTAQTIRRQRARVEEMKTLIRVHCTEVQQCLASVGQSSVEDLSLAGALQCAIDTVSHIEAAARHRKELEGELERMRRQLLDIEQEAEQAQGALQEWRAQWAAAVERIGLTGNAAPAEANQILDDIEELLARLKDADDKRERIAGIDRDTAEFSKVVQRITGEIAGDLAHLPVEQAVADLYDRLTKALADQARWNELHQQRKREEAKCVAASQEINRFQADILTMCREAGCGSLDELPDVERRSAQRQKLECELRDLDAQLAQLASGAPLDDFILEALKVNPDELPPTIERLSDEIAQWEREGAQVSESIGSHRNELLRMDGSADAALAHEKEECLLAKVRTHAETYARLRLASAVLRCAIERYREKNQGPVLKRASDLFAELTLGLWQGLRADYNLSDEAVLVGVRADGRQVGVEQMSEGTCDQLYLALRLASLETYLADNEPIPFIVDDILIKFDDDRAVAAIKVLARLSQRTQVILFTHHEHLLKLAQDNLDDDVLFIHELDADRTPVDESAEPA
jgi:uncharacterized protein YhaN